MVQHQNYQAHLLHRRQPRESAHGCDDAEIVKAHQHPKYEKLHNAPPPATSGEDETVNHSITSVDDDEFHAAIISHKQPDIGALTHASLTINDDKEKQKHVSFSNVQVRTYDLILGDNPDCSFPLSLGWRYNEQDKLDVEAFEHQRELKREERVKDIYKSQQQQQQPSPGPFSQPLKEKLPILPLTLQERRLRLRSLGYTEQQLRKAERKRRIELSLQWASGQFPKQMDYPYSQRYFLNYVL